MKPAHFPMKGRFLLPLLLVVVLAAGCGGGGGGTAKLETDDVAVVGTQHVKKDMFDQLMGEAKVNLKAQGQTFPKAGTSAYSNIRSQAVSLLVQEAEKEAEAAKLGIVITAKDIDTRLTQLKKQYFNGSEAKYKAQLKKQGLTDAEVRQNIKSQLVAQKLFNSVTKGVTVSKTAIAAYYIQHLSQYQTPASRAVRYILVGKNKSSLAGSLFQQLSKGGDWCKLAKKYSKDPSSSGNCGKATFSKGQTVPEFDKLAFSLPTNKVGKVNTTQYGWFVLEPTAAVKPAHKSPVSVVGKEIQQTLLQTKKNSVMTSWVNGITKSYCHGKIKYQAGYTPSPDPCAATNTTSTTTST
jgi:parvulin-like peptidyl-prolyl isomerase